MILWFVLTLELSARLQITRKCICTDWKTLEKNSRQIYKQILALKEFSQSIFFFVQSKKALNLELFFIVYFKTKQKHRVRNFYFYFCQKMEFRTYFVLSYTFSHNWIQSLTNSHWVWASCYNVDFLLSIARRLSSRVAIFTRSRVFNKLCSY